MEKSDRSTSRREERYKKMFFKQVVTLAITYLAPIVLVILFFQFQFAELDKEKSRQRLMFVAEKAAAGTDLFLEERCVDLRSMIEEFDLLSSPSDRTTSEALAFLHRQGDAFGGLALFDSSFTFVSGAGTFKMNPNEVKAAVSTLNQLRIVGPAFYVGRMLTGPNGAPYATIGVRISHATGPALVTALIDLTDLRDRIRTETADDEVSVALVDIENSDLLLSDSDRDLSDLANIETKEKIVGIDEVGNIEYGFSASKVVPWTAAAVSRSPGAGFIPDFKLLIVGAAILLGAIVLVLVRANIAVKREREKDDYRMQLVHASKLVSVGEMAAGIAHEINNPLAIIASEAGLVKDLIEADKNKKIKPDDLLGHIQNIREAAYRGRDITGKLLGFVRKSDFKLEKKKINEIINDLTEGFYSRKLSVSNIDFVKKLDEKDPEVFTDENRLRQVVVNMLNNAFDAIKPPGVITIETIEGDENVHIRVSDTGEGVPKENLDKLFMPFFTTKEVGKGTGLGLSVSYGIVKNLGGDIKVESEFGKGATFDIVLPKDYRGGKNLID